MQGVMLAGGLGARISEESDFKPKLMLELQKLEREPLLGTC
jgi:NDP-sugar pyrophosphorylase family protein